mgnify:CR=1 FL=1
MSRQETRSEVKYRLMLQEVAIKFAKQEQEMFPYQSNKTIVELAIRYAHEYMQTQHKADEEERKRVAEIKEQWGLLDEVSEKPRQRFCMDSSGSVYLDDEEGDDYRLTQFGVACQMLPSSNPIQLNYIHK